MLYGDTRMPYNVTILEDWSEVTYVHNNIKPHFMVPYKTTQGTLQSQNIIKGPYADHILIPQGSTGSSTFFNIK